MQINPWSVHQKFLLEYYAELDVYSQSSRSWLEERGGDIDTNPEQVFTVLLQQSSNKPQRNRTFQNFFARFPDWTSPSSLAILLDQDIGEADLITLLSQWGADINTIDPVTHTNPLSRAIQDGRISRVQRFLQYARVDWSVRLHGQGFTYLHVLAAARLQAGIQTRMLSLLQHEAQPPMPEEYQSICADHGEVANV